MQVLKYVLWNNFLEKIDGDEFTSTPQARQETRDLLEHLAALSDSGLYLFILYHANFIPEAEQVEFVDMGLFYHQTNKWAAVPYVFPEGIVFPSNFGRVFHIV